jgi:ubiquinone/menaquinone biosynthesis C-methylase UbiE
MSNVSEKKHEHKGRSSREMLDARKILKDIGLKSGDQFLDAGCGDGYFSEAAAEVVGPGGRVYAFDVDGDGIGRLQKEIAEKKLANIEARIADVSRLLPLADESVDVVFISNVLHGLVANGEWERALKEVARVIKPHGKLAIVEFKKNETPLGPPLSIRLSPEEVEMLAKSYGFSKVAVKEAGPYHYSIILEKW